MREKPKIKTSSFVPVNGEMVELCTMPPEFRQAWATEAKKRFLNSVFHGRAVFWAEGEPEPKIPR